MEPVRPLTAAAVWRRWIAGPLGVRLLAIFFLAATIMLLLAGAALLWPDTPFEAIWPLNPPHRAELMPYRLLLGPFFFALSAPMALACLGCIGRRRWGWWLGVAIIVANGLGDAAQIVVGRILEGVLGIAVAGAIVLYLTRPSTRAAFGPS